MSQEEIRESLQQLRSELDVLGDSAPEVRTRLLSLVEDLEEQLGSLPREDNPLSLEYLRQLAEDFEVEHPRITSLVNRILVTLSNMGV